MTGCSPVLVVILHQNSDIMNKSTSIKEIDIRSFYKFIRLNKEEQGRLLTERGMFLDLDDEEETMTRLYFLDGFFVEEVFCKNTNQVIEMIPFKRGYRLESFLGQRHALVQGGPFWMQWCAN